MKNLLALFTLVYGTWFGLSEMHAAVTFNVTGVYDSTNNTNVVDRSATTTGGNQVGLEDFKSWVATAYTGGYGGVIDFDGKSSFSVLPHEIDPNDYLTAKYGIGFGSTLNISNTSSSRYLVGSTADRTPISGTGNLGKSGTKEVATSSFAPQDFAFGFSAADQIIGVGATMISRQSNAGDVTATIRFSDGTFETLTTTIAGVNAADDTFFGFRVTDEQLASGTYITGLEFTMPHFRGIDDLAFIVVPEPGYGCLLLMGAMGLILRRRR